jgi:hypothetical protein
MALALDGTTTGIWSSSNTGSAKGSLTTGTAGSIVIVAVHAENVASAAAHPTFSSVSDSAGHTYTFEGRGTQDGGGSTGAYCVIELWWAYISGTLSAATFTLTASNGAHTIDDASFVAFGVKGFTGTDYQTNPWDANVSFPAGAGSASATIPTISGLTTTSASTMLIGFAGWADSQSTMSYGTGYTVIGSLAQTGGATNSSRCVGEFLDGTLSSGSIAFGATAPSWAMVVSALALAGTAGSGTSVTADSRSGLEFLSCQKADAVVLAEVKSALQRNSGKGAEIIAALVCDAISPTEAIAALIANAAGDAELLASLRSDTISLVEGIAVLRRDAVLVDEIIAAFRSDVAGDAELLAGLRSDIVFPTEFVGGQRRDTGQLAEVLPKVSSDTALEMEDLGALAVTGDAALQLEGTAKFSADAGQLAEVLPKVLSDTALEMEDLGALAVTGDAALQLEGTAKFSADANVQTGSSAGLRSDIVFPTEFIGGQRRDVGAVTEVLPKVLSDATPEMENLGALAVTGDAALQLEGTAKFSADANVQTGSSTSVLASSGSAIELLIKVTSDRSVLDEILASLSASPVSEVEITVGVMGSAAEPIGTSIGITVDRAALFEILAAVSRDQSTKSEIVSLATGVTGNAALALEILGGLAFGSPVTLEICGNSFILGRLLKNSKNRIRFLLNPNARVRSLQNQKARVRLLSNLKTRD